MLVLGRLPYKSTQQRRPLDHRRSEMGTITEERNGSFLGTRLLVYISDGYVDLRPWMVDCIAGWTVAALHTPLLSIDVFQISTGNDVK